MGIIKKMLSVLYDLRMSFSKSTGLGLKILSGRRTVLPPVSFYTLEAVTNTGEKISFKAYRGKKLLLVNLASKCGFTPQYKELQTLQNAHSDKLIVMGFPSNDFAKQEPGSDQEIASFCEVNYGITFQLFTKASVKGSSIQPVYEWLSNPSMNGWNSQEPTWNFCKYLVDENGILLNYFSSSVSPLSEDISKMIT